MQPLNRAERTNTFYGFLLFFLITIGIVITVVFFSTKVRAKDSEQLRSKMLAMQKEKDLADSFKTAMNVVLNELSEYEQKVYPPLVVQQRIQIKIDRLGRLIRSMPDDRSKDDRSIYEMVVQNLAALNDAKLKIRNLEDGKN